MANRCAKLKAKVHIRLNQHTYSTSEPNFSRPAAKSKTPTCSSQYFKSAVLNEFNFAIL